MVVCSIMFFYVSAILSQYIASRHKKENLHHKLNSCYPSRLVPISEFKYLSKSIATLALLLYALEKFASMST